MQEQKSIKVLYLCSYLDNNIINKYKLNYYSPAGLKKKKGIVRSLKKAGFNVSIVSPIFINDPKIKFFRRWKYKDELNVNIYFPSMITFFPFNIFFLIFSTIFEIIKLKKIYDFDVIIFYNYRFEVVIPAIFFRLLYKTPIIIQYEDGLFDAPNKFTSIVSTILESIFKRLLNGAILNNLNFKNRILTDNYCVIRGFIDDNIDVNLNLDTNHKDKKIVLFSGQIDKIRGIDIFLDICEKASKDEELKDKLEFWITGHGKEKLVNKVKERVSQMSNVKYLGFLPYNKYKETLEKADILVNLQKPYVKFSTYCFPSKIIEFMNTGKIIISTKISDIENIATDKIILIECNPNDVINVLRQILKNYKMFANYGNNAKKWVFNNCTYTNAGEHLKVIIERAIKLH